VKLVTEWREHNLYDGEQSQVQMLLEAGMMHLDNDVNRLRSCKRWAGSAAEVEAWLMLGG
jgi:hypothetical protein